MESWTLLGWGILFFKALFFGIVTGAILLIVHALRLPPERARFGRWIWVLIASIYVLAGVWMLVWPSETSFTVVAMGSTVMLVAEVAYLARVVLPPRREAKVREGRDAPTEVAVEPAEDGSGGRGEKDEGAARDASPEELPHA